MDEEAQNQSLIPDFKKQELIDFFSNRYGIMKEERKKREEAFLTKIGSREIGDSKGYQKVKK